MGDDDFEAFMIQARDALDQIAKGNADGYKALYSRKEDVTLGNPFGGFGRGWDQVVEQVERAASYYRDGEVISIESVAQRVSGELAYSVEIERFTAKVGGADELSELALRTTCVYRREDDGWKLIHRHGDPRVSRQTAESVIQK
jgi:ketosteroid isomerase-like protein